MRTWLTSESELWNNQCTLEVHPGGFTRVFLLINALSKQKRVICRAMRKPRKIPLIFFDARLMYLNNYLPFFAGSSISKNNPKKDLNDFLLHAIQNGWG